MASHKKWRVIRSCTPVRALFILFCGSLAVSLPARGDIVYPENPFVTDDAIYVAGTGVRRFSKDPLTKAYSKVWGALTSLLTFEPVVVKGVVLIGSSNGLHAIDSESGEALWHLPSRMPVFSPVVRGETVYAGAQDGVVRSVNLADGAVIWERDFDGWIYPPALHGDLLVAGGSDSVLHGLHAANGSVVWSRLLPQELVYRPVSTSRGLALITTFSGDLMAIDIESGDIEWQVTDPAAGFSPLVSDDRIYMGSLDGTLRVRELADGELLWEYHVGEQLPFIPRIVGDAVLLSGQHGRIAAVDKFAGQPLWHKDLPYTLASNPLQIDGKVFVVVEGGSLFALEHQAVASDL